MLGTEEFVRRFLRGQRPGFGPLRFHECAGAAELCARSFGATGPCATVSTACSAGAMALLTAAELVRTGEADLMLAGGTDSLCRLTLNGFGSLLLLDPKGCKPFDARRAGISLGEGAAMLVVESEAAARARGAPVLARLTGWGASCDAWHPTAPHPEGRGAHEAMRKALACAGLEAPDIDFACAHGTGTPENDLMETKALRRLFGQRLPPVASLKRCVGHTLAASGPINAVVCVQALLEQHLPPNLGFEELDPTLAFGPVLQFRPHPLAHVLSNSFGFGGNNVALVFSKAEAEGRPRPSRGFTLLSGAEPAAAHAPRPWPVAPSRRFPLAVVGAGVVSPSGNTVAEVFLALARGCLPTSVFKMPLPWPPAEARVCACAGFEAGSGLDAGKRRKLNRLQQMALAAARQSLPAHLLRAVLPERVCVALGTGLGALNDTAAFLENMVLKEERAPRPLLFTNSVHNSLASQVAIEFDLRGLNSTPVHREICFEAAFWQGANELLNLEADLALVGAADELSPYVLAAGRRWGWWDAGTAPGRPLAPAPDTRRQPPPGEGSAVFALARPDGPGTPLAWVSGVGFGRFGGGPGLRLDPGAEAAWIQEVLERHGHRAADVDFLLSGAGGRAPLDQACLGVAEALSRLAGRPIPCLAYKPWCGEHYSAPAFGFLTALGLVRGEIPPAACARPSDQPLVADRGCRLVALCTFSPGGTKAICCVCA
jgi:3-oxoacyl-(acyl-carrier-protein) synthase